MSQEAGKVEVAVVRKVPIPDQLTDERIADLVSFALIEEQAEGSWQVAVAFVDALEIRLLHQEFMDNPESTDILTFPYDDSEITGGDIAICVPVAEAQAAEYGKTPAEELAFLILHGLLHLTGHDDTAEIDRRAMLARQESILTSWGGLSR
jgi:probable rRNA maturation factor